MATITISNSGGNWNSTSTWSPATIPTAVDDIVATSGSGPLTVNIGTAQCKSIDFTNYTDTFTVSSGQALTVSGNLKFNPIMTVSGTGDLKINNTGNLTCAGQTWTGNLTFAGTSKTYTLLDNWIINGNLTLDGVTSQVINGFSITVGGDLTNISVIGTTGTAALIMNGTGTLNCSSTGSIGQNLTINTLGTITINNFQIANFSTFTYVSGTITGTKVLNSRGSCSLNSSGMTWNQFIISYGSTGTFTLLSNLNVANSMLWSANAGVTVTINNNNINFGGTSFQIGSLSNTTFTGSVTVIFTGACVLSSPASGTIMEIPIILNCSSNTVTLPTNGNITYRKPVTINSLGSLVTTNNVFRLGTGSSIINNLTGITFQNITIVGNSSLSGSQGLTISSLSGITASYTFVLSSSNIYNVTNSINLVGTAAFPISINSSTPGLQSKLILENNSSSTQTIAHVNVQDINSALGKTIWNYKGSLINNLNWNSLTSVTRNPNISSST